MQNLKDNQDMVFRTRKISPNTVDIVRMSIHLNPTFNAALTYTAITNFPMEEANGN